MKIISFVAGWFAAWLVIFAIIHYNMVSLRLYATQINIPQLGKSILPPNAKEYAEFDFEGGTCTIVFSNLPDKLNNSPQAPYQNYEEWN